ncbi:MAG: DUF3422 domain-containing protein [Pseudomonadota bacterium]
MQAEFDDHPQRVALTNELHARPFQQATAPGRFLHYAFKQQKNAAERDHSADRAHLLQLLDHFGASHPPPEARQHAVDLGRFRLKWESHTEFVSYTLIEDGPTDTLFSGDLAKQLSTNWLRSAPGKTVAAIQCELIDDREEGEAQRPLPEAVLRHFDQQSVAAALLLDGQAIALGDFRIHAQGYTRFAILQRGRTGPRRLGRVTQRMLEVETYRIMAMLALPIARNVARRLNEVERELSELIASVIDESRPRNDSENLAQLMSLSAEIEAMAASSAFRFDAAEAYERIVDERISTMREKPIHGRQQFAEFMARRFDPAMRTVSAAKSRLSALSNRAARTGELLRTRVNVTLEQQNKSLLESMDRRAGFQFRLQETVEGLSAVAISYYAISLFGYLLDPVAAMVGIGKPTLLAIVTLPVVFLVWWFTRQIRKRAGAL